MGLPQRPSASTRPAGAQLLAAVVDHRPVGHHDPPPRRDRRLLSPGGRPDRLAGCGHQPPARGGQVGPAGELVARRRDLTRANVGRERVVDRDRVGLRQDRQALAVGDDPAQVCEAALDPRELGGVRGDRVRHPVALDHPHIPPVGRDDQPVRLDERDRQHRRERSNPGGHQSSTPSGSSSST